MITPYKPIALQLEEVIVQVAFKDQEKASTIAQMIITFVNRSELIKITLSYDLNVKVPRMPIGERLTMLTKIEGELHASIEMHEHDDNHAALEKKIQSERRKDERLLHMGALNIAVMAGSIMGISPLRHTFSLGLALANK